MKKRLLLAAAAILSLSALNACHPVVGKGDVKEEARTTASSFNSIEISAPVMAKITVQAGATASVQLSGYDNLLKQIKTEISNNTLRIYLPDGVRMETDKEVVATITVPALVSLDLSGASNADIIGKITGNEFAVDISGSSDVTAADISTQNFSADISGSGDLEIKSGNVQEASFSVSGSGSVSAFGLQSQSAAAAVSGAGDIELSAAQKLEAAISGAGGIKYKGHPQVTEDISGAGSLTDAN